MRRSALAPVDLQPNPNFIQRLAQPVNGNHVNSINGSHINNSSSGAIGTTNTAAVAATTDQNGFPLRAAGRPVGSRSPGGTEITSQATTVSRSPGGTITEHTRIEYGNPNQFVIWSESGDMWFDRREFIGTRLANGEIVVDICRRCHCFIISGEAHRCPQ